MMPKIKAAEQASTPRQQRVVLLRNPAAPLDAVAPEDTHRD
jgi:hypothetical protein